jgi:peptidoglycan/LPS O-acetylase OafA/YrhL
MVTTSVTNEIMAAETHPFAVVIGFYLLRGHSLPVRLLGEFVPLVLFPLLAYHLVEHPMIRLGSRLAARVEKKYEQRELNQFRQLDVTTSTM